MSLDLQQIKNSSVLVRVCYDLSNFEETARIQDSFSTIKLLLKNQNKVILLTHWGRPSQDDKEVKSLQKMLPVIQSELDAASIQGKVEFLDQYSLGFEAVKKSIEESENNLFVLENTRFDKAEKSKDPAQRTEIAKKYALLGNYFIDEAFAVSHRQEATNAEIKDLLPHTLGVSHAREVEVLSTIKQNPQKPFMVVMAGAKLETKLPLINKLLPKADKILLGGMLAFTFVKVAKDLNLPLNGQKMEIYPELFESRIETNFYETAKELLTNYSEKLVLPIDFQYGEIFGPKEIFDVGEKTLELYKKELSAAKMIFWNGTLGYYEQQPFEKGTVELAKYISELPNTFVALGGGDTNSALPKEILQKVDFASMGGGATLEFLSGN